IQPEDLQHIGYQYNKGLDKWHISDTAADYLFTDCQVLNFTLPGTLKVIVSHTIWAQVPDKTKYFPIMEAGTYLQDEVEKSASLNFIMLDNTLSADLKIQLWNKLKKDPTVVLCFSSEQENALQDIRMGFIELLQENIHNPVVLICDSQDETLDPALIHYARQCGGLLLDGFGDGLCLGYHYNNVHINSPYAQLNSIAFGILQATRTRISKTEYISCPSCGRTLFDLQETTAKIRARTNHLKGVKIAIMGCIVNGPGEMADADFGYVGSGPGKITLYKGKEVVKRNVNSDVAVEELITLLKENDAWVNPA